MNLVINYAAVGFRPYLEIGEFLNVGVIAVEAKSRYLAYRLLPAQRTKRIRSAFPEFDISLYRAGLRRLESELAALSIETNSWSDDLRSAARNHPAQVDLFSGNEAADLFKQLTRPAASLFFFASRGTRLATDVDEAVDDLYRRYVEHWNLTPIDYEEKKLTRDLRLLLKTERLERYYREVSWVGTSTYHLGIPLAYQPEGNDVPLKAIKPLNLAQATPTRIYMYGDDWIARITRLRNIGKMPPAFLFVVKKPKDAEGHAAASEICDGLEKVGAKVVEIDNGRAILDFARIEEPEDLVLVGD